MDDGWMDTTHALRGTREMLNTGISLNKQIAVCRVSCVCVCVCVFFHEKTLSGTTGMLNISLSLNLNSTMWSVTLTGPAPRDKRCRDIA